MTADGRGPNEAGTVGKAAAPTGGGARWLALVAIAALALLVVGMGWHRLLSFKTIGLNYEALQGFIAKNLALALAAYIALYATIVALSLPGALVMTLAGGLFFGWKVGAPATIVAATLGATILFLIARSSLGEPLAARAGPWLDKLRQGFQDNALSYLLFLRLVPAFPFVAVNLAAAVLGVPLATYVAATFFGIMPGTIAYSVAGSGLGSVVEAQNRSYQACLAKAPANPDVACPYTLDTSALVTRELVLAFALLGLVALIPAVLKRWRARNATA